MSANYCPTSDMARMHQHFGVALDASVRFAAEVWPCDRAPAILLEPGGPGEPPQRRAFLGQFGLLPYWSKDPTLAKRTYNARAQTAPERSNFKDSWLKGQRCIIPAEWIGESVNGEGKPVRWKIARKDGAPMGVAGLWSRWWALNGTEVMSFAMLTVDVGAHPLMQRFQTPEGDKQMVVVLDQAEQDRWLNCPPDHMMSLMRPFDAELFTAEPAPLPARVSA